MRLLTHNMLQCHVKSCNDPALNFPLQFQEVELEQIEAEENEALLLNLVGKIDWPALVQTTSELGITGLPPTKPDVVKNDPALMKRLHEILLETNVAQGKMVCRGCGHSYPIKDGIPNMLLAEHEI
ncbi:hypothetical protein H4R33_000935 [Dimargaris cristalligena]|uniref:Trm112p-domain-containing protein n=1 Tax=Dimargaris cristalligena TaxID=215637 RepID=A0A4P9ZNP4_9FUNG|nr:hypothetical protein H4R33_000935 [Dimargaris cristalligena]RKP34768.1 hypothetical protein BJ085DRAFT_14617 [Dimargaris cristalligena]|eukprot:RKP34768.1 hypothetical protein BJ085DRAFT_14617 [Dimargaris cristalligena]